MCSICCAQVCSTCLLCTRHDPPSPACLAACVQIQKFAQGAPLAARLRADADRLAGAAQDLQHLQGLSQAAGKQASQLAQQMLQHQQQLKKAVEAVVGAGASAKSSAPAQQAAVPGGKQQRQGAGGASPAAAAAAQLAAMQLHTACQQLLVHGLTGRQLMEQAARLSAGAEGELGAAAVSGSGKSSNGSNGRGTGDVLIESFMQQQAKRAAKEQQEEEERQQKLQAHAQRQARIETAKRDATLHQELAAQQLAEQQQNAASVSGQQQQEETEGDAGIGSSWQQQDGDSLAGSEPGSGSSAAEGSDVDQDTQQ